MIACGFNKETDIANRTCFLEERGVASSADDAGVLLQMDHPIYRRNNRPIINKVVCSTGIANTRTETPNTANKISSVSHKAAVRMTGMAFLNCGCEAPWLNTKTFCAPRGSINPTMRTFI